MPLLPGEKVQTLSNPGGEGTSPQPETTPPVTEEPVVTETTEPGTPTEQTETGVEAKPETDAKATDDTWEKEYLEQFGEIKAESVHEALENYNNGKAGFDQTASQLAKFKALAKQLGANDLDGFAQMIEAQIPRTEHTTGVELEAPDFSSIKAHFETEQKDLAMKHFDDGADREAALRELATNEKASMLHAQSSYDAGVKAMQTSMSPVIDVVAALSATVQGLQLNEKWGELNPVTQKTYAGQKGEIVNFIKNNPDMLMSNEPFESAIRAMAAADPKFLKTYHKNTQQKAAEAQRISQEEAKRKMAEKHRKGATRSTGDGTPQKKKTSIHSPKKETTAAEAASWKKVQDSEFFRNIGA